MAGASLFTLLDDIATILDEVSVLTKVAAKKTAGVLGDDLALNAQQVSGLSPDRELPIVWKVAKGSAVNKVILVPSAMLISYFLPPLVTLLLVIGGLYLCFEGVESVLHKFLLLKKDPGVKNQIKEQSESEKIRGAIKTDFILSAEIIVITLGTVATEVLTKQLGVLVAISLIMTVGVYGLVALIVKLDDIGLHLSLKKNSFALSGIGQGILLFAPVLMKMLSFFGTMAMFLVGGGIVVHVVPELLKVAESSTVAGMAINFGVGVASGLIVVMLVMLIKKLMNLRSKPNAA